MLDLELEGETPRPALPTLPGWQRGRPWQPLSRLPGLRLALPRLVMERALNCEVGGRGELFKY